MRRNNHLGGGGGGGEERSSEGESGRLFFTKRQRRINRTLRDPCHRRILPNLVELLRQREIMSRSGALSSVHYSTRLYSLSVRRAAQEGEDANTPSHPSFSPIDARSSIYLGLSQDSSLLVELSIEVADQLALGMDTAEHSTATASFRLLLHHLTPHHLYPAHQMSLGQLPAYSTLYVGFSNTNSIVAAYSFRDSEHRFFTQSPFTDRVQLDIASLQLRHRRHQSLHISMAAIVSYTVEQRKLTKGRWMRLLEDGFVFDTGSELLAVLFLSAPTQGAGDTLFRIEQAGTEAAARSVDGLLIKNITASSTSFASTIAHTIGCCSFPPPPSATTSSDHLYMSERNLSAQKVLLTLAQTVLKVKMAPSKFMGITGAEAYMLNAHGHTIGVLVVGVVEFQAAKYAFYRVSAEVEWNVHSAGRFSLTALSVREIDWMRATRGDWRPTSLPPQMGSDRQMMTNDVGDSLNYLAGDRAGIVLMA